MPFTRVAPSPGGASVASSGTHEDIDNIGSPAGWSNSAVSGMTYWPMPNVQHLCILVSDLFAGTCSLQIPSGGCLAQTVVFLLRILEQSHTSLEMSCKQNHKRKDFFG